MSCLRLNLRTSDQTKIMGAWLEQTPAIASHGGRVVKNTGDGLPAEFSSAVKAVRAAMAFQDRVYKLSIDDAQDQRILLRVGINIGDVIVGDQDIFGEGVNIAARLEGVARPGAICLSASARDQVHGKIGVGFADLGEHASRISLVRCGPIA